MTLGFVYSLALVETIAEQVSEIAEICEGAESLQPILIAVAVTRPRATVEADVGSVEVREVQGQWVCRPERLRIQDQDYRLRGQD